MKFIIVDSVKGGCGKSIESLSAAVRVRTGIDFDEIEEEKKHKAFEQGREYRPRKQIDEKVCIIDFDILGTSIEVMLLGGSKIQHNLDGADENIAQVYLNDLVNNKNNMDKTIVSTLHLALNTGDVGDICVLMSSSRDEDRQKFRISSDSNYSMHIMPTHFRGVIKKLINKINNLGYTTVIFDMPPNSDPYTDTVFELLLSETRDKDLIEEVKLEIVSNFDRAHVNANIDWLEAIYKGRSHRRNPFDWIRFVVNDSSGIFIENKEKIVNTAKDIEATIKNTLSNSAYKKGISIYYKEHNSRLAEYFAFNVNNKASSNLDFSGCGYWYGINKISIS